VAVNDAATTGAGALIDHIFGDPVGDADLASRRGGSQEKAMARCQLEMLERAGQIEKSVLGELNRARKKAVKNGSVDSAAALEAALNVALTSDETVQGAKKLVKAIDKKCAPPLDPAVLFPGACADPDLGVVEQCVSRAARCQACLQMEAFGRLNLDCTSCP
jgi:hypothetical protein